MIKIYLADIDANPTVFDEWIFNKFNIMKINYEKYIEEYNFSHALKELTYFFWNELSDR
jgi:valyl-tRNA synthetase